MSELSINGDEIRIQRRPVGLQSGGCFFAALFCLLIVLLNVIHLNHLAREMGQSQPASTSLAAMVVTGTVNTLFMLLASVSWCLRTTYTIDRRQGTVAEQLDFVPPRQWVSWKIKREEYPSGAFHSVQVDCRSSRQTKFVNLLGEGKKQLCVAQFFANAAAAERLGADVAASTGWPLKVL